MAPSVQRYVEPRLAGPVRLWLRVCRPTEYAVEAAAVVDVDLRVSAVAARFEHEQTGWRCTAFRIL